MKLSILKLLHNYQPILLLDNRLKHDSIIPNTKDQCMIKLMYDYS